MLRRNLRLAVPLLFSGGGIVYLLRDDFTTDDAAPLTSPRNAEPKGEWTVVENDGSFAVSSGRLEYTAQATNDVDDLKIYTTDTLNRDNIAIIMAVVDITSDFVAVGEFWGFSNDILPRVGDFTFLQSAANDALYPLNVNLGSVLQDNDTTFLVAVGNNGYFYRSRSGTTELMFVVDISSIASDVYAIFSNRSTTGSVDSIRVAQLAESLFDPAIDIASPSVSVLPDLPDGDSFIEFVATLPSSGVVTLDLRKQGASDYWQVEIDSTGRYRLLEVVSGTPTARITAPGAVANGERCVVHANGSTIRLFSSNTQDGTYASASNFATEVGFELSSVGTGGAIASLKVYPINPTGALANKLLQVVS